MYVGVRGDRMPWSLPKLVYVESDGGHIAGKPGRAESIYRVK